MTAPRTPPPLRGYTRGAGLAITWRCDECAAVRVSQLGSRLYQGGRLRRCAQCVAQSESALSAAGSAGVDALGGAA